MSAGVSRRKRWTGSQTTVPACRSAAMTTSGVSLRKSCGPLSGPRVDGGPSATLYADRISVTVQSVTCQPYRPWRSVSDDVLSHGGGEALRVLVDVQRHRPGGRPRSGTSMPAPAGAGSMRIPSVARNGFPGACRTSSAAPGWIGRSTQIGVVSRKPISHPVIGGQGGLDDLLLYLAVEGDVNFLPDVVLPDVDERVLLGQLGHRGVQPRLVARVERHQGGLQRRRREVMQVRLHPPPSRRCRRSGFRPGLTAGRSGRRPPHRGAPRCRRRRR